MRVRVLRSTLALAGPAAGAAVGYVTNTRSTWVARCVVSSKVPLLLLAVPYVYPIVLTKRPVGMR